MRSPGLLDASQTTVFVLAHDERAPVVCALEALARHDLEGTLLVVVGANGCTDGTEAAALDAGRRLARTLDVRVISLPVASKAAAWNELFGRLTTPYAVFTDADVAVKADAPRLLVTALMERPALAAVAARALPVVETLSWPTRWFTIPEMEHQGLWGGLYAVHGDRLRAALSSRGASAMPTEVLAEDAWLAAVLGTAFWEVVQEAVFYYVPVEWWEMATMQLRYFRASAQLRDHFGLGDAMRRDRHRSAEARLRRLWRKYGAIVAGEGLLRRLLYVTGLPLGRLLRFVQRTRAKLALRHDGPSTLANPPWSTSKASKNLWRVWQASGGDLDSRALR